MQTINVVANPYFFITADGVPQGVVPKPGMTDAWIGAALDDVACFAAEKFRFWFSDGVEKVVFTTEVARAVLDGNLFVADTDSAALCGISEEEFMTADECLKAAEAKASEQWLANTKRKMKPAPIEPTKTDAQIARDAESKVIFEKARAEGLAVQAALRAEAVAPAAEPTAEPPAKAKR